MSSVVIVQKFLYGINIAYFLFTKKAFTLNKELGIGLNWIDKFSDDRSVNSVIFAGDFNIDYDKNGTSKTMLKTFIGNDVMKQIVFQYTWVSTHL